MNNLIKNSNQIQKIKIAGKVVAQILAQLSQMIIPGNNGIFLAKKAYEIILQNNCQPNFLNYQGFPDVICVSINETLIHGIPNNRSFKEGDLVSVDVGCKYQGMHADAALTKIVGKGSENDQKLVDVTKKSLELIIKKLKSGFFVGNIGNIVSAFVKKSGYFLTEEFCGHGIGLSLHEKPDILNVEQSNLGMRLRSNMIICIEPMVLTGNNELQILSDGWSVVSKNKKNNCHFEHMLLITEEGCEVLTDYEKYLIL